MSESKDDEQKVTLVSFELKKFDIPKKVALMSGLVGCMLEGLDDEVIEVPLPNVKSEILQKVIEFCSHHVNATMAEIDKVKKCILCISLKHFSDIMETTHLTKPLTLVNPSP